MREGVVEIDGSRGEGGGQILRTSLALSMITRKPLVMRNIRAGRAKPGLRRQHLACVHAAAQLSGAEVYGAEVGSKFLDFRPREIQATDLEIDIGSAGSTTLVVQTILVAAVVARLPGGATQPLRAVVHGGTHNPMAPPFEFLARVFLPHLTAMGARVTLELDRYGFASGGGGRASHDELTQHRGQLTLVVEPGALGPIEVIDAHPVRDRHATAILARLPTHVAERELAVVREQLSWTECEVRDIQDAGGPANVLMLEVDRGASRELITGFGEKGLRAEVVAERACTAMQAYLDAEVPVGEHLADQLLLPLALAGGGRFRTATLSLHSTTNIETIRAFIDVAIRTEDVRAGVVDVIVG